MMACTVTGQGAGVAAAVSVQDGTSIGPVDIIFRQPPNQIDALPSDEAVHITECIVGGGSKEAIL